MVIFSTQDRKSAYHMDFQRQMKIVHRVIVKLFITNARGAIFNMFGNLLSTSTFADACGMAIPTWLHHNSMCALSEGEIKDGCSRQEAKVGRATNRCLWTTARCSGDPAAEELRKYVANKIYGVVMNMFVFGRETLAYRGFRSVLVCSS